MPPGNLSRRRTAPFRERNDSLGILRHRRDVKALLISIAVLLSVDAAFNHGGVTKRVVHAVGHSFSATDNSFSDSIFSK